MTETDDQTVRRPGGRPASYDPLEIAALFCDGANRGETVGETGLKLAKLRSEGGARLNRAQSQKVAKLAGRLSRYHYRYRAELLRPWHPVVGRGILKLDKLELDHSFGELLFNVRPLPLPLAIEPREKRSRGRPRKIGG